VGQRVGLSSGRGSPPVWKVAPPRGTACGAGRIENRGQHAINVVTVITGPCVGYAQFFGRIPSAGFHKTSLAPVVVRWTRPTVLSSDPMSPIIITLLVLLGVGLLLALLLMGIYNGLVVAGNRFKNAFAPIDVQLKRRYELIPNLVEAVKGYMAHERETLDAVIKARNSAMAAEQKVAANPSDPAAMRELNKAEAQLGGALGRLFALSEAYPDLKANQNMLALQEELSSTENKIAFARQAFNDAAPDYNIRREVFPAVKVAACSASRRRRCSKPQRPSAQRPRCRSRNPEPPPLSASHASEVP